MLFSRESPPTPTFCPELYCVIEECVNERTRKGYYKVVWTRPGDLDTSLARISVVDENLSPIHISLAGMSVVDDNLSPVLDIQELSAVPMMIDELPDTLPLDPFPDSLPMDEEESFLGMPSPGPGLNDLTSSHNSDNDDNDSSDSDSTSDSTTSD